MKDLFKDPPEGGSTSTPHTHKPDNYITCATLPQINPHSVSEQPSGLQIVFITLYLYLISAMDACLLHLRATNFPNSSCHCM